MPERLIACTAWCKVKMSCKTRGDGVQGHKHAQMLVRKARKDSMAEDVESEDTEEDGKARDGGSETGVARGHEEARRCGRMTRQAGLAVKKRLAKFCASRQTCLSRHKLTKGHSAHIGDHGAEKGRPRHNTTGRQTSSAGHEGRIR